MHSVFIRRVVIFLLVLSIPVSMFLSVHQVYRYQALERRVETLKQEQADLFERNKRMIANIAIVSSPERIEEIAEEELELSRLDPEEKLRIIVEKDDKRKERRDG